MYDVNRNQILKIHKDVYDALNKILKYGLNVYESIPETVQQQLLYLEQDGYLLPNNIMEIKNYSTDFFRSCLHYEMKSLVLEVTQRCNFRCNYCPYTSDEVFDRNHGFESMTFEQAKTAIDLYFKNSTYNKEKSISFYGGEPLIEFDLIKKCVQYVKGKLDFRSGENVVYHMTTNGSLLTQEIVEFLSVNNFFVVVSIDGFEEIHDKNRRFLHNHHGTFASVYNKIKMIDNLQNTYPLNLGFNAVWDGSVAKSVIIDYFSSDPILKKYSCEVTTMTSNGTNPFFNICEEDIIQDKHSKLKRVLAIDYDIKTEGDYKYLLERLEDKTLLPKICHHAGPCIAGQTKLYVTVNGFFFPCEKFSQKCECANIGNLHDGFYYDRIEKLINLGRVTEDNCKKCWAIRLCSMCAVMANGSEELSPELKNGQCLIVKKQILSDLKDLCTNEYMNQIGRAHV